MSNEASLSNSLQRQHNEIYGLGANNEIIRSQKLQCSILKLQVKIKVQQGIYTGHTACERMRHNAAWSYTFCLCLLQCLPLFYVIPINRPHMTS